MTCLSCPHLLIDNFTDCRVFYCGHDESSTLDTNERAAMITIMSFGEDRKLERPIWCPIYGNASQCTSQPETRDMRSA